MRYETRGADTRTKGKKDDDGPVFYNKVQVFNRDLSVMMISLFAQWRYVERSVRRSKRGKKGQEAEDAATMERDRLYAMSAGELDALLEAEKDDDGIRILDALAATGLRSIRYAKEIPGVKYVVATDVDGDAAEACGTNIRENHVDESRCTARHEDAVKHMINNRPTDDKNPLKVKSTYDVIDLDPYGTCAPFLDAAVQCVADGGLLCVTSTDMTVLSGGYPETCYGRYGAMPIKTKYLQELALRIVLNAIETNANKYGRHIVPVLSLSIDFYIRVFVRVYKKQQGVKRSCVKRAFVLQSTGCPSFYLQPLARQVGNPNADNFQPALLHHSNEYKKRGTQQVETTTTTTTDTATTETTTAAETTAETTAAQPPPPPPPQGSNMMTDDETPVNNGNNEETTEANAALSSPAAKGGEEEPAAQPPTPTSTAPPQEKEEKMESPALSSEKDERIPPAFCTETGAPLKMGGPFWAAPLHDLDWVTAALDRIEAGVDKHLSTTERLHGVLTAVSEELPDVPLYYTLPDLCGTLHCQSPKMAEVKAALSHAGYRCSQFHRDPDAIKTDAPPRILWDIFRCWCQKHPISGKRLSETTAAHAKILAVPPRHRANFATTAAMRAPKTKARRWAPNPEENWGPKAASYGRKKPRR